MDEYRRGFTDGLDAAVNVVEQHCTPEAAAEFKREADEMRRALLRRAMGGY